ncbi:multidrug efflux RND transporter permease subunit [Verrucomicrobia bacterium S94]|nr:multidrug efflux RND transporter permease subunit [Verrucomicrobia bacterium S94]
MNLSRYFVDRPIFASVLSLLVLIGGLLAMFKLPVAEYPEVTPPSVVVNASFPGANPTEIAETVATPLEEQINGVENMLYMNSLATSDGSLTLRVTFAIGTDPDLAQQLVQNRVTQAMPRLPDVTRSLGVTVTKSSPDLTMVIHLHSPDDRYDMLYLRNYASLHIKDELAKIGGVGEVRAFGAGDYAMRVWLDPNRVAELGMTPSEVVDAIRRQNVQVAAGLIGGPPYDDSVQVQMPVNVKGRLQSAEEFGRVIIKRSEDGVVTRLNDVARIELDAQSYSLRSLLDGSQAVAIPIFASPGANALQISADVRAAMERLQEDMPEGVTYSIVYDPTVFVRKSIDSVISSLFQSVLLVALVVIIFLQNWRVSIIPLFAVPVSIIGTFAFMLMFGFSINVLSLFGLILAIGIVVDDAIVVVENVDRNVAAGLPPREATIKAMKEVTGPVIATTMVLAGVFIPIAFISGLTGQFYRQFALTIAIAAFISTFNSLTLSPAMSALLLRSPDAPRDRFTRFMDFAFGWFFRGFNRMFDRNQRDYEKTLKGVTRHKTVSMVIYALLVVLAVFSFKLVPKGFVPLQDKQYLISFAVLPPGATLERTEDVLREMHAIMKTEEGVKHAVMFPGLSINGFVNSPGAGISFIPLEDFEDRKDEGLDAKSIAARLQQRFNEIDGAYIAVFPPPPVRGLGRLGGFKLQIEDRADQGTRALDDAVQAVLKKANAHPALTGVFSSYNVNFPQLMVEVDRTKAEQLGVPVDELFRTMQVYLGSLYVNDFNQFGRTYQVIAQADKRFRSQPGDIARLQTRNLDGNMVPLGAMVDVQESYGPETAMRYNSFLAADINGNAAPGYSSGQAQDAITQILDETLPQGMDYDWTEMTYQEKLAGNTAIYIFPLCLLLIFLILAAQYESLTMPLAVILIVPMSMLSAMFGLWVTGADNNIFTQIALFVLAGLASKNAILIVEFARELERQGETIVQAAVNASRMRLRPILMTSVSFIAGVLPLMLSTGAGSEMRRAIGLAVFSGMVGVTLFGLVFTPIFYIVLRQGEIRRSKKKERIA